MDRLFYLAGLVFFLMLLIYSIAEYRKTHKTISLIEIVGLSLAILGGLIYCMADVLD